jgi:adiponectin receptor
MRRTAFQHMLPSSSHFNRPQDRFFASLHSFSTVATTSKRTVRHLSTPTMTWSYVKAISQHRPHSTSYIRCARSIWHLHDETINIWTHLIPFAVFCAVSIRISFRRRRRWTDEARANSLYFPAATCLFLCSTLYHTFANHNDAAFWQCLDHCSITAFICASSCSFTLLAYSSKRTAPRLFLAVLTVTALGLLLWTLYGFIAWNWSGAGHLSHALYGAFAAVPALSRPPSLQWRTTRARKRLLQKFQALIWISAAGACLYTTRLIDMMMGAKADWGQVGHFAMHTAVVIGACIYGCELLSSAPP